MTTTFFRPVWVAASFTAVTPTLLTGQDHVQSHIDSVVKAEMARQRIPGVGVAVIKGGEVMLARELRASWILLSLEGLGDSAGITSAEDISRGGDYIVGQATARGQAVGVYWSIP